MSQDHSQQLVEVNGLQCVERDGEFWFSATSIGQALGYSDPSKAVRNLYQRHVQFLQGHKGGLDMRTPGGVQEVAVFDEVGTYYLIMKSETPRANEVSMEFARALKRLRQAQMAQLRQRVEELEESRVEAVEAAVALPPSVRSRISDLVRYRKLGLTHVEVAKLLSVSPRVAQRIAREAVRLGLLEAAGDRARRFKRRLTEPEKASIRSMRDRKRNYSEIARELGRNKGTVREFCLREGV